MTLILPKRHPHLLHLLPYVLGDSLGALARAARRGVGIDQNMICTADLVCIITHWPKLWRFFHWLWTGGYVGRGRLKRERRKLVPKAQRNLRADHLPWSRVQLYRTRPVGGRRIYQARTHMHRAAELGVKLLMLEAKGSDGFLLLTTWLKLQHDWITAGKPRVGIMTLMERGQEHEAMQRLRLAHQVGFPVAVLPRCPKPAGWDEFAAATGCRVWGRWRRR